MIYMKLLFILALFVLPMFSFAQSQGENKKKEARDVYYTENYQQTNTFTSGAELRKAANRQFLGIAIGIGGTVIGTVITSTDANGAAGPLLVGSASIASLILNISAWSHVKRAGQMIENNRLSFSGRGLVINLN